MKPETLVTTMTENYSTSHPHTNETLFKVNMTLMNTKTLIEEQNRTLMLIASSMKRIADSQETLAKEASRNRG